MLALHFTKLDKHPSSFPIHALSAYAPTVFPFYAGVSFLLCVFLFCFCVVIVVVVVVLNKKHFYLCWHLANSYSSIF